MKLKNIFIIAAMAVAASSCDFLEVPPTGVIDDAEALSHPDEMVTAAYASLGADWYTYPFNLWPFGDLASDDCLKGGSGTTDTDYHPMEVWSSLMPSSPGHLDELWYRFYVAISRCNRALISLDEYGNDKLGKELATKRRAEVHFLRAHWYFKLAQVFYQVPWIDETVVRNTAHESVTNVEFTHAQLMQKVIDDFQIAYDSLDIAGPGATGRATKEAAAAYLAKCYLTRAYGDGYEATTGYAHVNKADMDSVLKYTNVVIGAGYDYEEDFGDLFMQDNRNGKESVFSIQHSDYTNDNTQFGRANWSNMLNGCWGIWSCGWDFHKPSQNLVNAFKTKNGLPMFNDFDKEHNEYPINGAPTAQKWDPRLFHTVGMPTFPYKYEKEYTLTTDNSRTPATYGYYTSLKEVPQRSKGETFSSPWQAFDMNEFVIRFTDVMLWRAEAMIETGDNAGALEIINKIRGRAKKSVAKYIGYAADQCEIELYDGATFNADPRQALRWERRLEMAMEHERYFDLRRWGLASQTLKDYFASEQNDNYEGQEYATYLKDAFYTTDKNEYWPVPYNQMYYTPGLYEQNRGYTK